MKPTKQLIRGLRETAARLRGGARYCWTRHEECNCGLLVQTLLEVDRHGLLVLTRYLPGCWNKCAIQMYCPATGLPLHQVAQSLDALGFEKGDFARLEWLDGNGKHKERAAVAAWMDAEADQLEARRAAGELPERGMP